MFDDGESEVAKPQLLKLLYCILDRGNANPHETLLFENLSHEELVRRFVAYLNLHRHHIGYCQIESSHALNDKGVDIILRAEGGKIGFQIKSHFDVSEDDFAANVKRQLTESFSHGLDHYIILICSPLKKEGKKDLQAKVSHLLNELSVLQTDYHSTYGPSNAVKFFLELPPVTRDELLKCKAIEADGLHSYEKGYEHLPEVDDDEIRRATEFFESFGDDWWDIEGGNEAYQRLRSLTKEKQKAQFDSTFLPTVPIEIRQRRESLITSALTLLSDCRKTKSWDDGSEGKLCEWLEWLDEDMIPYTSLPNLLRTNDNLQRFLAIYQEMDRQL